MLSDIKNNFSHWNTTKALLFIGSVNGRMKTIDVKNSDFWKLLRPPLIQFSKFNSFLWVYWFLGKLCTPRLKIAQSVLPYWPTLFSIFQCFSFINFRVHKFWTWSWTGSESVQLSVVRYPASEWWIYPHTPLVPSFGIQFHPILELLVATTNFHFTVKRKALIQKCLKLAKRCVP